MIGTTLDERYTILRLIGKGGMGAVFEARNTRTNRRVAVKLIQGPMEAAHIARFQREASVVGAIDSQHITLVYDTGVDRATNLPYIAMEMLDGEDVDMLLDRLGPLPVDLALRIAYQACLGLECAHKVGIVHRDIKGANLFLHKREGNERIVKILDFGIAKTTGTEVTAGGLTQTGTVLGSPLYMSPEQAKGAHIDGRSDLWSLGITLYEMLCGSQPLAHIQQIGELIIAICTAPVPSLQARAPHLPPPMIELVHRALMIDPAARFQSAAEMGQAIRAFLPHGTSLEESMLHPNGHMPGVGASQMPSVGASVGAGSYAHAAGTYPPIAPAMMPPGQTGPQRPQFASSPAYPPMPVPGQTGPQRPQFASSPAYPPASGPMPVPGQTGPQVAHATSGTMGAHSYGTTAGMSQQQPAARTSKVPLIVGGVALLVLGGIGATLAIGMGSDKPLPAVADTSAQSAQPTVPIAVTPNSVPTESASKTAAPATSTSTGITQPSSMPTGWLNKPLPTSTVKRPTKDEETSRK